MRFLGRYRGEGESLSELRDRFPRLANEIEKWLLNRQRKVHKALDDGLASLARARTYLQDKNA